MSYKSVFRSRLSVQRALSGNAALTFILYILSSTAQHDNACSSFIVLYTNSPPLGTSRTGPLHDCPWLRVNKPWPHTLPLSAVWFPIGQPVVSILLCLCFHQHGAQTTLSFPLQASTNTLLPLYCPEPNITSHHNKIFVPAVRDAINFARSEELHCIETRVKGR